MNVKRRRAVFVVALFALAVAMALLAAQAIGHSPHVAAPSPVTAAQDPLLQGGARHGSLLHHLAVARPGHLPRSVKLARPHVLRLTRAHGRVFDVRRLKGTVVKRERLDREAPGFSASEALEATAQRAPVVLPRVIHTGLLSAPAPAPSANFAGLDFANWGAGHPPDTNGDVGPTYYIQTVNVSIGIYNKATGARVAAFTFNAFMSQGHFGNLCDTDNFGDPVVLYDSFEDRWFITDFAFKLDGSGNVSPQHVLRVLRRLEDRRSGQRRLELLLDRDPGRPRRLPEVRRLAGRDLHVGQHVRLRRRGDVLRLPRLGAEQAADVRRRAEPCSWSTSPATPPTSRCCPPTRGSRRARRPPASPSSSSRPSSS